MSLRQAYRKIFKTRSPVDFPGGYIPAHYVVNGAGSRRELAVVLGDVNGRDYAELKKVFAEVKAIDVVDNGVIPQEDLLLQDASKPTTLPDKSVDYVVAGNVLEHMYGDMACLVEINRVLRDDGRIFVDTPYYSDAPFFHYRLYSPLIFHRMLEKAGFRVVESSYRGLVVGVNNNLFGGLALMAYPFAGSRATGAVNEMFLALHKVFARSYLANRLSKSHFGEFIVCEKSGRVEDELEVQRSHFGTAVAKDEAHDGDHAL